MSDENVTAEAPEVSVETSDRSLDAVLDRAFEANRDERGRFAPKEEVDEPEADVDNDPEAPPEGQPESAPDDADRAEPEAPAPEDPEVPGRFSPEAKQAWKDVPAPVKAEIGRAFRELEQGIEQYRERLEPLRQYDEMARQQGTTLADAAGYYINMENLLANNPLQGLDAICRNLGTSLKDVAAHVLGQPAPDQSATAAMEQELHALRNQARQWQQREQQAQQQRHAESLKAVQSFAEDKKHSRFNELAEVIGGLIKNGIASDLPTAYAMADRLNPAPEPAVPADKPETKPAAQTRKADLSINGAPGSNPASRKSKSIDEAFDQALSASGLSF